METNQWLKSFFTEYWKYTAVNTACKLNLFDTIGVQALSLQEMNSSLHLNQQYLSIFLKALTEIGFLAFIGDKYSLTELSIPLTETHPQCLKYACMNWSNEHMIAWQSLDYSLSNGKSAFEKQFGLAYFDYLNNNPEKLLHYHKAMFEYARDDYQHLPSVINFGIHQNILDVGGGLGAAITRIKQQFPQLNGYLLDLPKVVEQCNMQDVEAVKGDFLYSIPAIADALLLSRVLHDWNDEKASLILRNCFEALPEKGYLYIIENCSDKIQMDLSLLSLNMLVMCESYERSASQYKTLAQTVGFHFQTETQLNELQTILIFTKP